ncbi:hypothetical protein LCGC14_0209540 [marine sediment metagenome]|uniref:Uncharacterized protein n=1 Tax=marine sediment metagenome TaxID=412755 RepID=A0A0F9XK61_9ZZZZ
MSLKGVWKSQAEYIETEYGAEKLKRGRWRILQYHNRFTTHGLWHQCEKTEWDMYLCEYRADIGSDFSINGTRKIKPNWHCENCFAVPPASIVAVWCLLEPDNTSLEVSEVLELRRRVEEDDPPGTFGPWSGGVLLPLGRAY